VQWNVAVTRQTDGLTATKRYESDESAPPDHHYERERERETETESGADGQTDGRTHVLGWQASVGRRGRQRPGDGQHFMAVTGPS